MQFVEWQCLCECVTQSCQFLVRLDQLPVRGNWWKQRPLYKAKVWEKLFVIQWYWYWYFYSCSFFLSQWRTPSAVTPVQVGECLDVWGAQKLTLWDKDMLRICHKTSIMMTGIICTSSWSNVAFNVHFECKNLKTDGPWPMICLLKTRDHRLNLK